MILYHAVTTYHLLEFMVHRLAQKNKEEAILIIADVLVDKFPHYNNLIKKGLFKEVIIFPYRQMHGEEEELYEKFLPLIERTLKYDINDFIEIHVAGAQYYFSIYLIEKNIPFIFYEEGAGIFSNPETLGVIVNKIDKVQHNIAIKYNMYEGQHPIVKKKIGNLDAQSIAVENIEDFNIIKELLKLTRKDQNKLLEFFGTNTNNNYDKKCVLILTQQFANLQMLTFEEQILIYQLFVDYFFENQEIIFKPHPDDLLYYGLLFPEAEIIREKFPSEFLPLLFNGEKTEVATINSTGIDNLKGFFKNLFKLNREYQSEYKGSHKYYTVAHIINLLKLPIKYYGINQPFLKAMVERNFNHKMEIKKIDEISKETSKNIQLYILDKIDEANQKQVIQMLKQISYESSVVFLNTDKNFWFYDCINKEIWENITPLCINKNILSDHEVYSDREGEVIYFYSKNKECIRMVEDIEFKKTLSHTGVEISLKNLSEEEKRIKVLEGMLEATEKRLMHYIKLVEEKNNN